jgi:hypothetical protein
MEQTLIRTALKTGAVVATLAGTAFAAAPANADTYNHNTAVGNTTNVMIVGGYGVTCGSVSVGSQSGTGCNGNHVYNGHNHSGTGGWIGHRW